MSNNQDQQVVRRTMRSSKDALDFAKRVLSEDEFWAFMFTFVKDIEENPTKKVTRAEPVVTRLYLYVTDSKGATEMNKQYYDQCKSFMDALEPDSREVYLYLHDAISTYTPEQLKLMREFLVLYRQELADREACDKQLAEILKVKKPRAKRKNRKGAKTNE